MGVKRVVRGFLFAAALCVATTAFADTLSGSGGAFLQSWVPADLNANGSPYWDNTSMDGYECNVGYYLLNAPTAPLPSAPGVLPFWGTSGGNADLSFYFQRTAASSMVSLQLEIAGHSNINEFGWYDIANPSVLHPLFLGPDSPPTTGTFAPSLQYGFYLNLPVEGTYYTQSSLNSDGSDRTHQHFVIFRESAVPGAEIYWIGIEDLSRSALDGNEGCVGDYNDMLIRLSAVPEPSTAILVLAGAMFIIVLNQRRR